jgi:hypothetical protein
VALKNNPIFFESVVVTKTNRDKTKTVESAEDGYGRPPFPAPSFPTAHLFVSMGFTKNLQDFRSKKANVGVSVPFDATRLDEVWATVKPWVSRRLMELINGKTSTEEPLAILPVVLVDTVPASDVVSVPVSCGHTVPLGNFEFASIEIGLTLLSDPDKVVDAYNWGAAWTKEKADDIAEGVERARAKKK